MKIELLPFQKSALVKLRRKTAEALGGYHYTRSPQVVSFTAPTGAGKTVIMASLIEEIMFGSDLIPEQMNAIFLWLSDSPQLNEQSRLKLESLADRLNFGQLITVSEESFNQEFFSDGTVNFLNTQKLGINSKLVKTGGDTRQYTIWQTIANTVREKSDRLYVIIDEAHRGMQGRDAGRATTIMQKFLKGSEADGIPPMPVVIGMSATIDRFNRLVADIASTRHPVAVTPDEVRASGLLKDRIILSYPDESEGNKDMSVLVAAAADWKEKCEHWARYCRDEGCAPVEPIFVIQVENGTDGKLTATDIGDCLAKITGQTGVRFQNGEVIHTFGQTESAIKIGSLDIRYEEPSRIADGSKIKVVFFKENLSTGWDCPRAETMMSFRHASDATYIAQLLGRMVRTPLRMHINSDETLNDVHLFLPHFDAETVQGIADALQSVEEGCIPADVESENINDRKTVMLTVRRPPTSPQSDNNNFGLETTTVPAEPQKAVLSAANTADENNQTSLSFNPADAPEENNASAPPLELTPQKASPEKTAGRNEAKADEATLIETIDREAVVKFINEYGILTYSIRQERKSNYLISLFAIAHLLTQSGIYREAAKTVQAEIVALIRRHIDGLKERGEYERLAEKVRTFKMTVQVMDVFGKIMKDRTEYDLIAATETDLDRQLRTAEAKIGGDGVSYAYGQKYDDEDDPNAYKVDVIIYAADDECMKELYAYAEEKFHRLDDDYRRRIARETSDRFHQEYDDIVANGDEVSKHNFRLPDTIEMTKEDGGKLRADHLFIDHAAGGAIIKLNKWEEGVLAEEAKRDDFVLWLRNPPRKPWSLCLPYEDDGRTKGMYPDFIIIRRDQYDGYLIDILEPHSPDFSDNLAKAKALAKYAKENPGISRIQLIRRGKDAAGNHHFKRLDMARGATREKVLKAMNDEELDRIFATDGFFM